MLVVWAMHSCFVSANNQIYLDYIARYKDIAIQEMQRTGIPASIKLAQALQESGAGTSELAVKANNHFGIKCASDWTGETYGRIDDDKDAFGNPIKSCFRVYKNGEESFIAHSEFLKRPYYKNLFKLEATDYRGWAQGLLDAGYATDRQYATRLIDLIERYQLYQYDRPGFVIEDKPVVTQPTSNSTPATPAVPSGELAEAGYLVLNDVRYVNAYANESLDSIARRTGTTVNNLLAHNEGFTKATQLLKAGTRVYIQPKRDYYRGRAKYHTVKNGETMFDIAQLYGVKMDKLYERNLMELGTQPAVNEEIKLRGSQVKNRPRLVKVTISPIQEDPGFLFEEPIAPKPAPQKEQAMNNNDTIAGGATKPSIDDSFDGADPFKQPEKQPMPIPPIVETSYHIVKTGDTLWSISQRYGITVEALKKLNKLDSNNIWVGMRLQVP